MTVVGVYLLSKKTLSSLLRCMQIREFIQNSRYVYVCLCWGGSGGREGVSGWPLAFSTILTPLLLRDVTHLCGFAIETVHAQGQVCAVSQGSGAAVKLQLTLALSNPVCQACKILEYIYCPFGPLDNSTFLLCVF